MQWEMIVALAIAIPVILLPAAFVWYLSLGGLFKAMQEHKITTTKKAAVAAGK